MAESPGSLTFRRGTEADRDRLLEWRNDPDTRAASRKTDVVGTEEHSAWLERVLADPHRHLLIVELDAEPIGQIRFDRVRGYRYELSVSLDPAWRGRGLGTRALRGACGWLWKQTNAVGVVAEVREENEASMATFLSAGFRPAGEGEAGFLRLVLERPEPWAPEIPGRGAEEIAFTE
jgi:RimJ/RimL family protein N-acetyltransferase